MTISPESFLVLEKSLTVRLENNWRKTSKSITKALLKGFVAEDFPSIEKTIAKVDLSKALKGEIAYVKAIGNQAAYFGISRLVEPKKSEAFKNKLLTGWVSKATKQTGLVLSEASKLVRRRLRIVVAKEFEIRSDTTGITKAEVIPEFVSAVGATTAAQPTLQLAASLHTSKLASMGFLVEAVAIGKTVYMWNAMLDARTCPICEHLDTRVFKVKTTYNRMSKVLEATDINDLKRLAPWANQSKAGIASFTAMSTEEIVQNHYDAPPAHPLCRCYIDFVEEPTEIVDFGSFPIQGIRGVGLDALVGDSEGIPFRDILPEDLKS